MLREGLLRLFEHSFFKEISEFVAPQNFFLGTYSREAGETLMGKGSVRP